MNFEWTTIIFILLLIDSIGAVFMSWCGQKWWTNYSGRFAEFFPPAKGWSILYFVLMLVIGHLLGLA